MFAYKEIKEAGAGRNGNALYLLPLVGAPSGVLNNKRLASFGEISSYLIDRTNPM